jgi:hypothetical protein
LLRISSCQFWEKPLPERFFDSTQAKGLFVVDSPFLIFKPQCEW